VTTAESTSLEPTDADMPALPSQSTDFPGWYAETVRRADLAEHAAVRGAMVIKPYGYAVWEAIQRALDDRIKRTGHVNAYFPLFVPRSLLEREGDLVEGFSPEVAWVTEAAGRRLEEPLAVRPTSEAVIWDTYARWIQSYRDLPLLVNQWANAVRWELRPRLFLRTTEFLWQEGHTAHETAEEALAEVLRVLHEVYVEVARDVLAMPVLTGRKSAAERFPGAVDTFTMEALMRDGRALQAATSHFLGDGFARAYGVRYTDRDGVQRHPFAASWGASSRLVGGLIMAHGDDRGLRLPPAVAPHQAVVVPIPGEADATGAVVDAARAVAAALVDAGVRTHVDARDGMRPGAKFHEWELRGVPVRVEIGPRDLAEARATLARRDGGERERVPLAGVPGRVRELLDAVQAGLLADATAFREAHTLETEAYAELRDFLAARSGFAVAAWCGDPGCEARVKADTSATIRCLPEAPDPPGASCIVCGRPGVERATWAQAY
jgi:prolyl-tRNA synthetase